MINNSFWYKKTVKKIASIFLFLFLFLAPLTFIFMDFETENKNFQSKLKTSAPPIFQINSPNNYSLYGKIAPNFSLTITSELGNYSWYEFIEKGESSVPIELYGVPNENVIGTFNQTLWDNLNNGTALIRFYVNNSEGEVGHTDAIIRIDITNPLINIISPIGDYFNETAPEYIVEISEPNLNKTWYTLNTNTTKHFFTANGTIKGWNKLNDGLVNITFFANDSVKNINSQMTQITKDTVAPTGSIEINGGDTWTNSTSVSLSLTYGDTTSGVLEVRYRNEGGSWTAWEAVGDSRAWTLLSGDGTKMVYYEIRDNAYLISQFNDSIILDTTAPTGSIIINDDDTWTNTTSVMLTLTYGDATSGVLEVRYRNEGDSWTAWEAAGDTKVWTLLSGDGMKTVYYEIRDNVNLTSQFNDSIILDTTAPTGSIIINDGDTWTNTTSVSLSLTYGDATSGVLEVRYRNEGDSWTAWETAGDTKVWTLLSGDGTKTVYYEVKDNANLISQFNDSIVLDTTTPTGSIIINDDDTWTNTTSVMLSLTYGDATSGVLEVRYRNEGDSWTAWEAVGDSRAWILLSGDGTKTVYYEIRDNAYLISQFNDSIILDTTAPTGSIIINGGDTWTNTTSVSLSLTYGDATSGVLEVRYRNEGGSWTVWEAVGDSRAWTLLSGDGTKTVYYEIRDNVNLISQFNDSIILDTTTPTGSIIINDDDTWTNTTSVMLSLTYGDATSGVLEVRYRNEGDSWTAWEAAGDTKVWTLLSGDGTKTVYYEIRDNVNLISQFNDSIILDTTAPTGSIIINDDDTWTNTTSVMLSLTYGDATSGVLEVRYRNEGDSWTAWEAAGDTKVWTLLSGDGTKTVYYEIRDNVNLISQFNDSIILDTTAPTGSIIINDGDMWTNSTSVSLSLIYGDVTSGVLEVRYRNEGDSWTAWEAAGDTKVWTLLSGDGTKTVYYEVKDNANLISQFNDSIVLDTTAPTGSIIINDDDTWTNTTSVMLSLTYGDATSGVLEVRYRNEGGSWTAWEAVGDSRSWTLLSGDGTKTVYYEIRDNAYLISQFNDNIVLDTTAPTGSIIINDDDTWTNTTSVMLTLTYGDATSGVLEVRYRNEGDSWTAWEAVGDSRAWILLSGDGTKTVYYEIRDNVNLISQFNDSIVLDTTAPTGSIIVNDDDTWTNTTSVMLTLTYGDATSGVLEVRYRNEGDSWTAWETAGDTKVWTLLSGDGTKTVYYEIKDNAYLISQFNDSIVLDTTAPTGSIIINDDDTWTNTTSVMLSLTYGDATSGVLEVRYRNEGGSWTAWEAVGDSRAWTLLSGDGTKTVYYEIRDNAYLISQFNDNIVLDTTAPTGSIIINDDDTWTNSTSVSLSLTYGDTTSGVLEVRYRNEGGSWTAWEAVGDSRAWTLLSGDGTKTVYYEIKDNAYLISQFNDSIILDTTAPTGSIIINDDDTWTNSTSVSLSLTYGDTTSGVLEVRYRNEGGSWTAWEAVGDSRAWTLLSGDSTKTVYYEIKDNAYLISQFNDSIILDTTAPTGSIIINDDDTWTNTTSVMLSLTYGDATSGVLEVRYRNEGDAWTAWETAGDSRAWTLLSGDGTKTVYYEIRDNAYLISQFNDSIILDTTAPTGSIIINDDDTWTNTTSVSLSLTYGDATSGVLEVRYRNEGDSWTPWEAVGDTKVWTLLSGDGMKTVYYEIRDNAYLISQFNDSIVLDTTAPTGSIIINDDDIWTNTTSVMLSLTYGDTTSGVLEVRYRNEGGSWTAWETAGDSRAWTLLSGDGTKTVYYEIRDNAYLISQFNDSIILDTTAPTGSIIINDDDTWTNTTSVMLSLTYGDATSGVLEVRYRNEGGSWTAWEAVGDSRSWTLLSGDGTKTVYYEIRDNAYLISQFTDTIGLDTTDPLIVFNDPINKSYYKSAPPINITVYELNPSVPLCTYTVIGYSPINNELTNNTEITLNQDIWNDLPEGEFQIVFTSFDLLNHRTDLIITLYKDTMAPTIEINSPANKTSWNSAPYLNISAVDPNLDTIWYSVYNINITLSNNVLEQLNSSIWSILPDQGEFEVHIYANDTFNHLNTTFTLLLYKDVVCPTLIINSPSNNSYHDLAPFINVTVLDPYFDSLWYRVEAQEVPLTNNTSQQLLSSIWDSIPDEGDFTIYFYANDSAGNLNNLFKLNLHKDILDPVITIINPDYDDLFGVIAPSFELFINELNLNQTWYMLYNQTWNSINYSFTGLNDQINQGAWDGFWNGTVTIRFYANDTLNHIGFSDVIIRKNIFAPVITIINPNYNELFGIGAPNITIYKSGLELNTTWYSIDFGNTNYTFMGLDVVINQTAWDIYEFSDVTITFYINDSLGKIGFDTVIVRKDPDPPIVTFIFIDPSTNNSYWYEEPTFRVSVFEPNIDTIWYRVGMTNVFISNNTDTALESAIWNILPQGSFTIEVFANDTLGYINDPIIVIFKKDTLAPKLVINQPIDFTYYDSRPSFNITVYDPNSAIPDCTYTVSGYSPIWLENNTKVLLDPIIWGDLADGEFLVYIVAYDTFGHVNNSIILTLYKDTSPPVFETVTPSNSTTFNSAPNLKISYFDPNLHKIYYKVGSDIIFIYNNTEQLFDDSIWSILDEGPFTIEFYANDTFGYNSSVIYLTLIKDITTPNIIINSPDNNTYYSLPPLMNVTISDLYPDTLWYTYLGTKVILSGVEPLDLSIWNSLDQGEFQINLFANDTAGNLNSSVSLTLFKDTFAPYITLNSPLNNTYWNTPTIFNITAYDPNLLSIKYQVVGYSAVGLANNTAEPLNPFIWYGGAQPLPEGRFVVYIIAEDTLGNINNSTRLTLYKDTVQPVISINQPQTNDVYGEIAPNFEINVIEDYINTTWYVLVGESGEIPFIGFNGTIDQTAWELIGNGTVTIRFYINDSAGNEVSSEVTVRKNLFAPIITINSPGTNNLFGLNSPSFVIYKSGSDLQSTWYTLNNGITNITFTGLGGIIDQTVWDAFGFGTVTLRFYVNDSLGNIGFDEVSIRKDPDFPIIIMNSPLNSTVFASTPFINLTIIEPNLDKIWYQINSNPAGITVNHSFFMDLSLWNSLDQGEFEIKLFANDTLGNVNTFMKVILIKDTIGPNITIIQPLENSRVGSSAPFFELSIYDEHGVDSSWYILSWDEMLIITFTGTIGRIDEYLWEQIWNNMTQGAIVTVRFYANDSVGNENFIDLNIVIDKPVSLPKFISNPLGLALPLIGIGAMVPVTLKLMNSSYYKNLGEKEKSKLKKLLASSFFLLGLFLIFGFI